MAASYFLCLHKESNQRNAPSVPRRSLRQRFATGGRVWRQGIHGLQPNGASSRRPRAVHAADPAALRRGFRGTRRAKAQRLLRQGLPRSALPGPLQVAASRRRNSRDSDRRQDAGEFAVSTGTYCRRTPSLLAQSRAWMPAYRGLEGAFSLVTFFWASKRKSLGRQGWRTKKHRDESRFSRQRRNRKSEVKMDSGFRRNDGGWSGRMTDELGSAENDRSEWIPAPPE